VSGSQPHLGTQTTTRLLDALHEPENQAIWTALDARFRPVIAALARRLGHTPADADEVAQQTLSEFVKAYRNGRYDRGKGRLSSWILGIAHHTALQMFRARRNVQGETAVLECHAEDSLRAIWADERDREILGAAMERLRGETELDERTLLAFELVALRGVPAMEAASQSGMTVDQVYVAKNRVTRKLRAIVEELTSAFEEDI
jgi:RNA polymerase sigma-70 factor (ECF subfamily)